MPDSLPNEMGLWGAKDEDGRRHREALEEARRQTRWSRRGAVLATVVGVAGLGLGVYTTWWAQREIDDGPAGVLVVVQSSDIGGIGIVAVAGSIQPVEYLGDGTRLFVDCLQPVEPRHLVARISDGPFMSRWIDVFSVATPTGEDVRDLEPPLPLCGPAVPLRDVRLDDDS